MAKEYIKFSDGSSYQGDVANGLFHGKGKFIYGEGGKVEDGNWDNGKFVGNDTIGQTSNEADSSVLSQDFVDQMLSETFDKGTSQNAEKIPVQVGALSGNAVNQILDKVLKPKTNWELSQDKVNNLLNAVDETE